MNRAVRILGASGRILIGGLIALLLLRTFLVLGVILPVRVEGNSMTPTLADGDRMVVDRTAFLFCEPARWDIVVLRCPHAPLTYCVKRIAGLPGEMLRIRDGRVWINGAPAAGAPGINYRVHPGQRGADEFTLGENEYFVLGDNCLASTDSRTWNRSAVRREAILGKVRHWPAFSTP